MMSKIDEINIEITLPSEWQKLFRQKLSGQKIVSVVKDVEELESSHTGVGSAQWYSHFGKLSAEVHSVYSLWPSNSTPRYTPNRNTYMRLIKDYNNVHSSTLYKSLKLGTIQFSIKSKMNRLWLLKLVTIQ
jgi:hypothetical protein